MIAPLTPQNVMEYIKDFNALGNQALKNLIEEANMRDDVLPPVQLEVGTLLHLLVFLQQPQSVLELGTGIGISTIFMALGLPKKGRITTIEKEEKFATYAKKNFIRMEVSEKINLVVGDVEQIVPTMTDSFDFIFQDSGKQTYLPLLDKLVTLLKPGGVLVFDDTLFPTFDLPERNKRTQRAIHRFNLEVKSHPDLESFILPFAHGLTMAIKKD